MPPAPPGSRRKPPSKTPARGPRRSWLLPIYIGVIALAVIAAWWLITDDGGDEQIQTIQGDPDATITEFWVEEGGPFLVESRELIPGILLDIREGSTCIPSADVAAARCPEIPGSLAQHAEALQQLIDEGGSLNPPPDSSASEWLAMQLAGLEQLRGFTERFGRIASDGWDDGAWTQAAEEFGAGEDLLGQAELQLARMLGEVEPDQRNPFPSNP